MSSVPLDIPNDPTRLPARARRWARIRGEIPHTYPHKTFRDDAVVAEGFTTTKREKRIMRHSILVGRAQSSSAAAVALRPVATSHNRVSKSKPAKVRRPNKKFTTALAELAEALPDLEADDGKSITVLAGEERGKLRLRSLPSKAGAMKRKERIVKGEMARFGMSMVRLTIRGAAETTQPSPAAQKSRDGEGVDEGGEDAEMNVDRNREGGARGSVPGATAGRWQALRAHIASTMERNPAFIEKK